MGQLKKLEEHWTLLEADEYLASWLSSTRKLWDTDIEGTPKEFKEDTQTNIATDFRRLLFDS